MCANRIPSLFLEYHIVTADNAGVWQQILVNAYGQMSRGSWGARVHKFLEVYSAQLADDPFVYALEIRDIEAAMLQEYDRVFDGLDEPPRQAERLSRLTSCVSSLVVMTWALSLGGGNTESPVEIEYVHIAIAAALMMKCI